MTFLDMALWAQQGGFGTRPAPQQPSAGQILLPLIGGMVCGLLVAVPFIIAQWKIFTKAGEPGWASLVPVYNGMILSKICGRGEMFGLLLLVPCVNIIISIMLMFDLARVFGKGPGFAVGLLLASPIFILLLAFGDAQYVGDRPARGRRRRDLDDDDDDRPRRRRVDDEDDDDRPRRRPDTRVRGRDEDEDDRPRRRPAPRDDDDDDPPPRPRRPGPR